MPEPRPPGNFRQPHLPSRVSSSFVVKFLGAGRRQSFSNSASFFGTSIPPCNYDSVAFTVYHPHGWMASDFVFIFCLVIEPRLLQNQGSFGIMVLVI